jgi:hypothetical protein
MAIKFRLTGRVSDAPRSLSYTPRGTPRFRFTVRVDGRRVRAYRVTAYGSQAKFVDRHLRVGDRVQIEGAYLRRSRLVEGDVRADTSRHVGTPTTPAAPFVLPVRFVPAGPFSAAVVPTDGDDAGRSTSPDSRIDAALTAALS